LASISTKHIFTRARTLDFLEKLSSTPAVKPFSLFIPPHLSPDELENLLLNTPASQAVSGEMTDTCTSSPTGTVIYGNNDKLCLITPPFPVIEKKVYTSLETSTLKSILEEKYLIGVVLVRLGSYAVGICRGDKLLSSKVGTGLVHGRHRQGGSSAHRFERHRDKQIESFLIRVCGHVREQLEPYVKSMDYIVYGGAKTTILMLQKYCPRLGKLDKPTLPPLLDIPEPRKPILETAVSRIWSSTIYEWRED
jgi:hypothetical protein